MNQQEAGTAAALFFAAATSKDERERFGNVYEDTTDGVYSYNFTAIGDPCDPGHTCSVQTNSIVPDGTDNVADWHTHPYEDDIDQFGDSDNPGDREAGYSMPTYISTPIGGSWGVFLIYGSGGPNGQLRPICHVTGPSIPGINGCP